MPEIREVLPVPWTFPITSDATAVDVEWTLSPAQAVGPFNFVWQRISIQTLVSGGIWSIMIKDVGASEQFMYAAVRSHLLVPDDSHMVDLVRPWVFKAHSAIEIIATNNGDAEDTLYLALHGYLEK